MNREQFERALRLYLVVDADLVQGGLLDEAMAAIAGGVTMIQLRGKALTDRELFEFASVLRQRCHEHAIPFIVNDRVDVALAVRADGVHVGVDDLPIDVARRLLGAEAIVGFSPESDEDARAARVLGASYLGVGPVFGTATKADAGPPIGPEAVGRRARIAQLPAIGIGGINAENAWEVMAAGGAGVAVVSAIIGQPDPARAAGRIAQAVSASTSNRHA